MDIASHNFIRRRILSHANVRLGGNTSLASGKPPVCNHRRYNPTQTQNVTYQELATHTETNITFTLHYRQVQENVVFGYKARNAFGNRYKAHPSNTQRLHNVSSPLDSLAAHLTTGTPEMTVAACLCRAPPVSLASAQQITQPHHHHLSFLMKLSTKPQTFL